MIAYSINAESGYAIVSISGQPGLEEFIDAARALGEDDQFYPSTHRICDFRRGELRVSDQEVTAFVEEARRLPKENTTRTALIANTEEERKTLESFAQHFDKGQFGIFSRGRDAIAWVREARDPVPASQRGKVRIHRLMGDVTEKDVLRMQAGWFNEEGFDKDAPLLWDLRSARLRIDLDSLEALARQMQEYSVEHRPNGKAAVLVSSKLLEGILKAGFKKGIQKGRLRFFWTEQDAYEFLLG